MKEVLKRSSIQDIDSVMEREDADDLDSDSDEEDYFTANQHQEPPTKQEIELPSTELAQNLDFDD